VALGAALLGAFLIDGFPWLLFEQLLGESALPLALAALLGAQAIGGG